MGKIWSFLSGKKPETPIKGFLPRIKNLFKIHYRGIFGGILPIIILPIFMEKGNHSKTVTVLWLYMAWCFFLQPVNIPVTGMIPIFLLPLTCSLSTDITVGCYMNEGIALFIVANMLLLLWNNSGLDRRLILWFLTCGDDSQCSARKLVYKCCVCGFFLSIFCNKLIVSNIMTQYVSDAMTTMQAASYKGSLPNYEAIRYILNNAIQSACSIGGIVIIHSSYATLAFRAIFYQTIPQDLAWPDIFNYLEYTIFAFPTALMMLILNIIYGVVIIGRAAKGMTPAMKKKIRDAFMNNKKDIPAKITLHEMLTLVFSLVALVAFFFRFTKYLKGWANYSVVQTLPRVRDATVAVLFVILLHSLPSGFRFLKLWVAKKKSKFGPLKPESGILWWRFVDKNVTYGYLFVIGSGVALSTAISLTGLNKHLISGSIGSFLNKQSSLVFYLLVCLITVFLANIMSGVPVIVVFLPLVMHLFIPQGPPPPETRRDNEENVDPKKLLDALQRVYLGALAVGVGASCGFISPFLYTAAYFCHYTGKVPKLQMAKYGVGSAILCFLSLWVCITFYAPVLWKPKDITIQKLESATTTTTTTEPSL